MGSNLQQQRSRPPADDGRPSLAVNGNAADQFVIGGMSCNNCARQVTAAIQGVPEVASASVTLEKGQAEVRWQP